MSSGGGTGDPASANSAAACSRRSRPTSVQCFTRRAARTALSTDERYRAFDASTTSADGYCASRRCRRAVGAAAIFASRSHSRRSTVQRCSSSSRWRSASNTLTAASVK